MWRLARRLEIEGRQGLSDTIGWWICLALAALSLWGASANRAHANPIIEAKSVAAVATLHRPLIWAAATAAFEAGRDQGGELWRSPSFRISSQSELFGAPEPALDGPALVGSVAIATTSRVLRHKTDPVFATARTWAAGALCEPDQSGCRHASAGPWQSLLGDVGGLDRAAIAASINAVVNTRVRYRSDLEMHGTPDQWAGPLETMRRGEGDCEDLAILKMWLLAQAGVPLADMYVLVVRSRHTDTDHAVLLLATGADFLLLDNLADAPRLEREASDYEPLYSVNTPATEFPWVRPPP